MFMGLRAVERTTFMLDRPAMFLVDYFNIMQDAFPRQKQVGPGLWSRNKRLRREPRLAGLSISSRNRGESGNGGFAVTHLLMRQLKKATRRRAEGYGRFHYLENAKFCSNSRGSCWEVLDHLIAAADEDLISSDLLGRGRELVGHAVRLLNGYMNYLKRAGKSAIAANPITDNQ
jgi:four helix bundle protein